MTDTTRVHQDLTTGGAFEIKLEGNPSTGFDWDWYASDATSLALVEITDLGSTPPSGGNSTHALVGAPVLRHWRVTARKSGTAQLIFSYRRAWESAQPFKTHTVIIDISI